MPDRVNRRGALRPPSTRTIQWAGEQCGPGSRVTSARRLPEGGWHENHALEVLDRHGGTRRLILRRWARPEWIIEDPDFTVEREIIVLTLLAAVAVPTPGVVAADPHGDICDVPTLLITRLPGRPPTQPTDMSAFLTQLATALPPIHALAASPELVPRYRTYVELDGRTPPSWLDTPKLWEEAFDVASGHMPVVEHCFIHRDYHPGNTLWSEGCLTGVIDWTQGSWGPPGIDLGWMRWNLLCRYGQEAADEFLAAYRALSGKADYDRRWDILAAVDFVTAAKPHGALPSIEAHILLERHVASALACT